MSCDGREPEDLARELGISGKELRNWLRESYPRDFREHGRRWYLTHQHVQRVQRRWGPQPIA